MRAPSTSSPLKSYVISIMDIVTIAHVMLAYSILDKQMKLCNTLLQMTLNVVTLRRRIMHSRWVVGGKREKTKVSVFLTLK